MPRALCAVLLVWSATAAAQTAEPAPHPGAATQHYDLNVYPTLTGPSGLYDLNVSTAQNGPPGTLAVTSAAPPQAYSFQDVLNNTHGYVSTGISTGGGHEFTGGVRIPLVLGKAELELEGSTGQVPTFKLASNAGKAPTLTYDAYRIGLSLHPTDDVTAYVGVEGVRLHATGLGSGYPFGAPGPNAFGTP